MRTLICILTLSFFGLAEYAHAQQLEQLLERHCADCHNSDEAQGQLDVPGLLKQKPLVRNAQQWKTVIDRIKGGEMPPEDSEQPSSQDRQTMLKLLINKIDHFDYSTIQNPGYEPARRLSNI
ncbi:MAG: c-type cytochrome, partial [Planctomycetota bacterium]|nr:c-type cytochrome [Planctomycetota bacterium]